MELSAGVGTIVLFGAMFVLLATGLPVVFVLGGVAISLTILLYGFDATLGLYLSTWDTFTSQMLLAIPLFLLMASVLQHSGIADDAYDMFYKWMGGLNGDGHRADMHYLCCGNGDKRCCHRLYGTDSHPIYAKAWLQ